MSSDFEIDTAIIGAGVIGLAVAKQMSRLGSNLLVIESENSIGRMNSSRNSGVIHAGIYYPEGSLKARFCVTGKQMLYEYCEKFKVPCDRIGKLIVSQNPGQSAQLEEIAKKAEVNGVDDLQFLNKEEVKQLEPELSTSGAILSPSTGIIDPMSFMLSLQGVAEECGVQFAFNSVLDEVEFHRDGRLALLIKNDGARVKIICRRVINAAGLHCINVRNMFPTVDEKKFNLGFARGNYFSYAGQGLFKKLIYPIPEEHGLGVHLTLNLAGEVIFGPDVEWVEKLDFSVNSERKARFIEKISTYFPSVQADRLQPSYAGIRPKLMTNGSDVLSDFVIEYLKEDRYEVVNLLGIESPGLTSSLAIAAEVDDGLKNGVFGK